MKKASTAIECLIMVTIIVIFIAIAVPGIIDARNRSLVKRMGIEQYYPKILKSKEISILYEIYQQNGYIDEEDLYNVSGLKIFELNKKENNKIIYYEILTSDGDIYLTEKEPEYNGVWTKFLNKADGKWVSINSAKKVTETYVINEK